MTNCEHLVERLGYYVRKCETAAVSKHKSCKGRAYGKQLSTPSIFGLDGIKDFHTPTNIQSYVGFSYVGILFHSELL